MRILKVWIWTDFLFHFIPVVLSEQWSNRNLTYFSSDFNWLVTSDLPVTSGKMKCCFLPERNKVDWTEMRSVSECWHMVDWWHSEEPELTGNLPCCDSSCWYRGSHFPASIRGDKVGIFSLLSLWPTRTMTAAAKLQSLLVHEEHLKPHTYCYQSLLVPYRTGFCSTFDWFPIEGKKKAANDS